jgi:cysteine synthase A
MLPDTGERYLSTPLFDGISADMTDEEVAISFSTATCRFETAPAAPAATAPSAPAQLEKSAWAEEFVRDALEDPKLPVVMFAFQWCEFCWSVRKLFARCGITYRSVDIDSTEMQKDDRGGKIRAVITSRTGSPTIPQVFVGGHFVGGTKAVFDAFREGRFQTLLSEHRVLFDEGLRLDPNTLLPNWLGQRPEDDVPSSPGSPLSS